MIVFKYALSPFEYRISKSEAAAKANRYEHVVSPMIGTGHNLIQFGDEPPSDYFIVLAPGQSFTPVNTITVPLSIADSDQKTSKEYIGPGEHVLELNVPTWPFDNNLEQGLRLRWQEFGTLWTGPVLSLPMIFHVKRYGHRTLTDCNAPAHLEDRFVP